MVPTKYSAFSCNFFLLTRNTNRLTRKDFPSGNEQIPKTAAGLDCPIVLSEEFVAVDDDNVYSDDENETNNEAPIPESSEMRNIMKGMRSYLDAHSNGEINNKMDDIERIDSKKDNAKKISGYFSKSQ
ncbi:hypothetical protein TNCV_3584951 [Trichonephila clavipes]|nr:hypothetical protein TNCV_3584951 [Trichonephila clavipes]